MKYNLKLVVLTPLHIGDGDKLLPYEVYITDKKAHIIRFENLIKQASQIYKNSPQLRQKLLNVAQEIRNARSFIPFERIIQILNLKVEQIKFDYVIPSDPLNNTQPKEVETFIKSLGKVFIPGSELKGAFRTAYAYYMLVNNDNLYREFEEELQDLLEEIKFKPFNFRKRKLNEFAQQWEEKIFRAQGVRQSAITDIFKTLHISDSPLTDPAEVLSLKNLRLVGGRPRAIWSECLKPSTKWNFDINIDQNQLKYLPKLFPQLEEKLKGLNQLEQFIEIVDSFYREFIDFELETLNSLNPKYNDWVGELKNIYQQLKQFEKPLLRLGKHTGRYTHSILLVLRKKNKNLFKEVLRQFTSKTRWLTKENLPLGWVYLITTKG